MEWWDITYLPPKSKQQSESPPSYTGNAALSLVHTESSKYVQHPIPITSLANLKTEQALPMFLTKRERHRIRKKRRAEEEQERRRK